MSCNPCSGQIAFSVSLNDTKCIGVNEIVNFPKVATNLGNGYNSCSGVFTAPKAGLYVFHVHALSNCGADFKFRIYRNDCPCASAFANTSNNYAMGGNTVALCLQCGERVYVKSITNSSVYSDCDDFYFTFTGYLLG
ncbi:hypothetical protein BsWGS_25375 [Bradybaena similaris]